MIAAVAPGYMVSLKYSVAQIGGVMARPAPDSHAFLEWYLYGSSRAIICAVVDDWALLLVTSGELGWFRLHVLERCTW